MAAATTGREVQLGGDKKGGETPLSVKQGTGNCRDGKGNEGGFFCSSNLTRYGGVGSGRHCLRGKDTKVRGRFLLNLRVSWQAIPSHFNTLILFLYTIYLSFIISLFGAFFGKSGI